MQPSNYNGGGPAPGQGGRFQPKRKDPRLVMRDFIAKNPEFGYCLYAVKANWDGELFQFPDGNPFTRSREEAIQAFEENGRKGIRTKWVQTHDKRGAPLPSPLTHGWSGWR